MILLRKLAFAAVFLVCLPLFAQTQNPQFEPITSALRAKEFDHAVELSRSALQQFPNDARLWTLHGIALASKGESKQALTACQQALKISPSFVAALEGAAQI